MTLGGRLPPGARVDVGVMLLLLVPSLAQVLLDPIAPRPVGVAYVLVSVLPLAWRRSRPEMAGLVASTPWLVVLDGFLYLGYVVAALLFFSVGAYARSWRCAALVTAWGAACGGLGAWAGPNESRWTVLTSLWVIVGAALSGAVVAHQRRQVERLRDLAARLEAEQARTAVLARAEERARIARDLHDVVGHEVTAIAVQAEAATAALARDPARAAAPVEVIRRTAHETLAQMRGLLGGLREESAEPASFDARPATGLDPGTLDALLERAGRLGVRASLTVQGAPRSPGPLVAGAVHRIVQEALTNAGRHAAGAPVRVALHWLPDSLHLRVANPVSSATVRDGDTGLGTRGMAERAELLGGRLQAGRRQQEYVVEAVLPLPTGEPR